MADNMVPTVRDCMSRSVFTLSPEESVFEAIEILVKKGLSGAPVVDEENQLVGILTEKDCIRVLATFEYGDSHFTGGRVADFMSEVKMTTTPDMDLFAVAHHFLATNFPSLPVLEHGKLAGRITRQDVLRGIRKFQRRLKATRIKKGKQLETYQEPKSLEEMQRLVASQKKEQLAALFSRRHSRPPG